MMIHKSNSPPPSWGPLISPSWGPEIVQIILSDPFTLLHLKHNGEEDPDVITIIAKTVKAA